MKAHASIFRTAAAFAGIVALGLAGLAGPAQETTAVTGTARYRERIALPPTAVFEATLEDVSRADGVGEEIGYVRLETPGHPPFRFSIPYESARIRTDGIYSVRASVLVDGILTFTTVGPLSVLTRGKGNRANITMQQVLPALEGMLRYVAGAATFTDCRTGQRWPVGTGHEYKPLEVAYLKSRRQPGEEVKASLEGHVAMRPELHGGARKLTLIVERYLGVWPGETCGVAVSTPRLRETYWKLTRLQGEPLILAEGQQEPNLVFRSEQNRLEGFSGCNNLDGIYQLDGSNIRFNGIGGPRMDCVRGNDFGSALIPALFEVRTWRILGQHLELYDFDNKLVARLEARSQR
jgi:uncharacterized lipoprotein YbaY/heat shock protein HslJ